MNCQSHHVQPLGRVETNGPSVRFLPARGPPVTSNCAECNGAFALGGPFWIDPIHDNSFLELVCFHAETFDVAVILPACFPHSTITCLFQVKQELTHNEALYKSSRRLFGLVSSCLQELPFPWYVMVKVVFLVQSNLRFLDDARFRPVHVLVSIFQVIRC